jgi:CubicO group peptidase (beta-lactamase class C family)
VDDELRGAPARGRRRWVALRGSRPAVRSAVLPTLAALVLVLAGAAGCGAGSDEVLARDVPTSGRASPIFAEVDVAMRQLVKWRCAGAGVLAISYRGHRVYSRGFGKLRGSATPETYRGCRDAWDPDAPVTPPETPMRIGSVTKGVVAAIVRPLVAARIVERRPWEFLTEDAEFDALLLDPELELLPASLRRYFHHPSDCPPGLDCAAPPIPSPGDAPPDEVAALCEPEEGADRRWPVVSIGHLLTHRSGLPRSNAQWPEVVPEEFAAIRGYTSRGDFAEAHQLHRAAFGGEAVDHAQELTARALGVATDDLYFVGHYDHRDRMPIDQQLKVLAGRCLVDWPGAKQRYSNSGHVLLGRVVDHLWSEAHGGDPSYSFAGRLGRPEEHAKSALAAFVEEELDLPLEEGGVEARYPIYGHQWFYPRSGLADEPAEPELRRWEDRTYTPRWAPSYHFYCVWRGDRCDASSWAIETLRWRWDLVQGTVPHWAGMHSDHYASGGLMAEPSAMLELVNRYQIGRGVKAGLPRPSWANGTSHGGSITGGRAFLGRHGGVQVRVDLPPRDEDGRITDDFDDLEEVQIQPTRGVAFFVGVAQQDDARCGDECDEAYEAFENVIRYVLARVDWDDVRHMIDGRRRRVVGLLSDGSDTGGRPIAWYADGRVGVGDRAWGDYAGEGVAGEATPGRLPKFGSYRLPSTRIGDDVLGITVAPDGTFIALFADGRAGLGALIDEGAGPRPRLDRARPRRFALPEGVEPGMIVAFAAAPDGELVTWLSDQTYLRGDVEDLSSRGRGDYRLPRERAPDELADATIDADGSVRALFDDGALIVGQIDDLRAIARPAAVVGVARAADGERLVVHDNGHVRAVDPEGLALGVGRVALEVPPEPGRDLAPLYASEDVVAVATDPAGIVYVWLRGGVGLMGEARLLADEESRLGLVDADLYLEAVTWAGDPEQIVDVAFRGDGEVVVWRRDGRLVDAVLDDLRGGPARPFAVADDRLIEELVGVTIDEAGVAHARYRDGSWSAGTPEALGEPAG